VAGLHKKVDRRMRHMNDVQRLVDNSLTLYFKEQPIAEQRSIGCYKMVFMCMYVFLSSSLQEYFRNIYILLSPGNR